LIPQDDDLLMPTLNATHDATLKSWVSSANEVGADFPIQNLPFGVFRRAGTSEAFRGGVAIGDQIIDLSLTANVFTGDAARAARVASASTLNAFTAMGEAAWSALRSALSEALKEGSPRQSQLTGALVPQADAEYALPARIGDYTDFYTSIHHATNVGRLFRPDNPLLPNYKWIPIGYHGRASSIVVSGTAFHRPVGQTMPPGAETPVMTASKRLDIELELGVFVGTENALGSSVPITEAESHVFGICLLNDWSARDLQAWEYQPLGPFLAKNFATSISPWIVTMEALAPYRLPFERPAEDPQPLPYLDSAANRAEGAFDIQLEVLIETAQMRAAHEPAARLALSNYRHAYWTLAQMVTHHTVNGCNLQPGDLLGTGTLSGPAPDQAGALIELSLGGKQPIALPNGEKRTFLEDGDAVTLRGWCEKEGAVRIGFGACWGQVLPAK
jgi:fumarylacetoacetase